jgi:hypothetical protein
VWILCLTRLCVKTGIGVPDVFVTVRVANLLIIVVSCYERRLCAYYCQVSFYMRVVVSIRVTGAAQAATLKSAKIAMTTRIFVYLKWMYRLGESGRLLVEELGRIDKCCKLMADVLRAHYFLSSKSAYTSEVTSGAAQFYLAAETILDPDMPTGRDRHARHTSGG